jgi:hypothetical protein
MLDEINLANRKMSFEAYDACVLQIEEIFAELVNEGVEEQIYCALDSLLIAMSRDDVDIYFKQGVSLAMSVLEAFLPIIENEYTNFDQITKQTQINLIQNLN